MEGYKLPVFEKGNLLSQEMLDAMKEYTAYAINNSFVGYSNGIMTGFKVSVEKGVIYIGAGLVWYEGRLLVSGSSNMITILPDNEWQVIKLVITDYEKTRTFEGHTMGMEVSKNTDKEEGKIEICRVRLQNGANLRSEYRDFADLVTQFDTISVIDAQWSAYGRDSINPVVLLEFAREAQKKTIQNPQDITFVHQVLNSNGRAINRELIQFYINTRLGMQKTNYDNQEIYESLGRVLNLIGTGDVPKTETKRTRRLIVD